MEHRYQIRLPNNNFNIEYDTYDAAIYALRSTGIDSATLAEVDEKGNVLSELSNEELRGIVADFTEFVPVSVFFQHSKGRLVGDE